MYWQSWHNSLGYENKDRSCLVSPAQKYFSVSVNGFKFVPILGGLIADAVEGKPNPWLSKFRWRDIFWDDVRKESSRYQGEI